MNRFIVSEVTKNWTDGVSSDKEIISQKFEYVIAVNLERGYKLYSFQLNQVVVMNRMMVETIIAVFEKI